MGNDDRKSCEWEGGAGVEDLRSKISGSWNGWIGMRELEMESEWIGFRR